MQSPAADDEGKRRSGRARASKVDLKSVLGDDAGGGDEGNEEEKEEEEQKVRVRTHDTETDN